MHTIIDIIIKKWTIIMKWINAIKFDEKKKFKDDDKCLL